MSGIQTVEGFVYVAECYSSNPEFVYEELEHMEAVGLKRKGELPSWRPIWGPLAILSVDLGFIKVIGESDVKLFLWLFSCVLLIQEVVQLLSLSIVGGVRLHVS